MSEALPSDERAWNWTSDHLPADGEVVETKIDDSKGCRNEQRLKRQGRLWYLEDGSMYVYYTPTHWRPVYMTKDEMTLSKGMEAIAKALSDASTSLGILTKTVTVLAETTQKLNERVSKLEMESRYTGRE